MRVLFASGKGGVGRTAILANLAAELAKRGKRVLVIDADIGNPNTRRFLGSKESRFPRLHLEDYLINPNHIGIREVVEEFENGYPGKLYLASFSDDLEGTLSFIESESFSDTGSFRAVVIELEEELGADVTLIDAPAGITYESTAILYTCFLLQFDAAVIVTEPSPAGWQAAHRVLELVKRRGKRAIVVVNQVPEQRTEDDVELESAIHGVVPGAVIKRDFDTFRLLQAGRPLVDCSDNGFASAVSKLADLVQGG